MGLKVLVTGSTGNIGNAIVKRLVSEGGYSVRALVRSPDRARKVVPECVELMAGDLLDRDSIDAAMAGVQWVFHAAGMPEQYVRDPAIFEQVNTQGTLSVLESALANKVSKVIYTSTIDVFAAPSGGTLREDKVDKEWKHTPYEVSKQKAEHHVAAFVEKGLHVVSVCPGAVYGPSDFLQIVAANELIRQVLNGEMPVVPSGGMPMSFIDGVTSVHIEAAKQARSGERFLVADCHASVQELVIAIAAYAAHPLCTVPKHVPNGLIRPVAWLSTKFARLVGCQPLAPYEGLVFLAWDVSVDASKAVAELGFVPTPLEDGIAKTVDFLRAKGLAPPAPQTAPTEQ